MDCFKKLFGIRPVEPQPTNVLPLPAKPEPKAPLGHQDLLTLWASAEVRVSRLAEVKAVANRIAANRSRYEAIEAKTGVPWYCIGAIHNKECSMDFKGYLGNGERIIGTGRKSTLVPAGRGPFSSFEAGAIDALGNQKGRDWSLGAMLYWLEGYNGYGYRKHGIPSPYLFAATTAYEKGGFPRDHVYDPEHVVRNPGCVAVFKMLDVP